MTLLRIKTRLLHAASLMLRHAKPAAPSCARSARWAATIILALLTTATWAADITQNTAVVINSSNKSTYNNKSITGTVPSSSYTGQHGNFISQGAIVVDGIELNLTIDGFTADYSAFNNSATTRASGISLVNGAKLHLTLKSTNTLIGGYGGAGIAVPNGCTLEITAASTGSLTATGSDHTVDRSNDGKYRFAMPLNDVTVRAQFENINNLNFGTITGLKDVYLYDGGDAIDISYGVEAVNGAVLSNGTDYDAVITNSSNAAVTSVTAIGTYMLTITGKSNYTGSLTKTFVVQEGLRGSGTIEAPYLIGSTDEWDIFVRKVNSGVTFAGQYIDLERNITVAQGISNEKYFQGTFNGNSHTITMNNVSGKGLFGSMEQENTSSWSHPTITIKDLTVAGSIIDSGGDNYCAAVVGIIGGGNLPCALENIIVTADITTTSTYVGGLAGIASGSKTKSISNCVFAGSINGGTHAARMVGSAYNYTYYITITNCLEVGTYTNVANFHPMAAVANNTVTVTNGYYVHPKYGSPNGNCSQGTQVFTITTDGYCDATATKAAT